MPLSKHRDLSRGAGGEDQWRRGTVATGRPHRGRSRDEFAVADGSSRYGVVDPGRGQFDDCLSRE